MMDCRMTLEQREEFLVGVHVAVLSLNQSGRGPLSVPVWYWYEPGGEIWFETEPGSRKGQLLATGTRVSLCVQDETPPYSYVSVEGPIIDIAEDDLERHQIPMAVRYLGEKAGRDFIAGLPPVDWRRYILSPERWLTYDGTKAT